MEIFDLLPFNFQWWHHFYNLPSWIFEKCIFNYHRFTYIGYSFVTDTIAIELYFNLMSDFDVLLEQRDSRMVS